MRIIPRIFQSRCTVCRRKKGDAIDEQLGLLQPCDVRHCPFRESIQSAIREAQQAKVIRFTLSSKKTLEGSSIDVSWEIKNSTEVSITGFGRVNSSGQVSLPVRKGMSSVEIVYSDLFGETFTVSKSIQVFSKPEVEILELKNKVVEGESFNIRFQASHAKRLRIIDESGSVIANVTGQDTYTSDPIRKSQTFSLVAFGKFNSQVKRDFNVEVFGAPTIHSFKANTTEAVDTMTLSFQFEYTNTVKAILSSDGTEVADVSGSSQVDIEVENKTDQMREAQYKLKVIGETGAESEMALEQAVTIYPQPEITDVHLSPDNALLWPGEVTLHHQENFCEQLILSDGNTQSVISPDGAVSLTPSVDTDYTLTPVGKCNFMGKSKTFKVEVYHPVKVSISSSGRVTMPTIPVTVSWTAANHTQLILEPGNIDVTNRQSYDLRLSESQTVTLWAINKKDKQKAELFMEVIPFTRANFNLKLPEPQIIFHKTRTYPSVNLRARQLTLRHDRVTFNKRTSLNHPKPRELNTDLQWIAVLRDKLRSTLKALSNQLDNP